jgi:hypothetical protein
MPVAALVVGPFERRVAGARTRAAAGALLGAGGVAALGLLPGAGWEWTLAPQLLVGGSDDSAWNSDVAHRLAARGCDVLEIPGCRDLDPAGLSQLSAELLAGMTFSGCDAFESWLLVERRRLAAAAEATIHEAAMARLGAGRPLEAIRFAARVVELNPFEESHHTLLVRSLAASGDRVAALAAAESCGDLFRRELGAGPSPAVREAVNAPAEAASAPRLTGVAAARAQLQAGKAAIVAGAVDAGLDCLRRAVHESRFAGDDDLIVAALTELGGALVHSVRGRDNEGAVVLHSRRKKAALYDFNQGMAYVEGMEAEQGILGQFKDGAHIL